jgi:hypothetical protein
MSFADRTHARYQNAIQVSNALQNEIKKHQSFDRAPHLFCGHRSTKLAESTWDSMPVSLPFFLLRFRCTLTDCSSYTLIQFISGQTSLLTSLQARLSSAFRMIKVANNDLRSKSDFQVLVIRPRVNEVAYVGVG